MNRNETLTKTYHFWKRNNTATSEKIREDTMVVKDVMF